MVHHVRTDYGDSEPLFPSRTSAFWYAVLMAGLIAAPVASQPAGTYGLVGGAILSAVLSIFESWRVWRADPDRQPF